MAKREKLGRLVLLEETETSSVGREYRAARLGPAGLDRLVSVTCFAPAISSHAAATKRLMEEARLAARLQNPGLVRVLGIGRVEQVFYLSTELVEGRTLASVLERCQSDSFPFAADHALMVASRAAAALEFLQGKKDDAGTTLFHGLLTPSRLIVMYDGEVKLKGVGLWSALREPGLLDAAARRYLSPEQAAGLPGDSRSDVYSLGLVLREALTFAPPGDGEPLQGLAEARVATVSGELVPLPGPLGDLLRRALQAEPGARFAGTAEMRKAIDALLFSGDFAPTTFDIAFFMHTLFRDELESEARALEEARKADYREFLSEEKPAAAPPTAAAVTLAPAPSAAATTVELTPTREERAQPTAPATGSKEPSGSREAAPAPAKLSARESAARAAAGLTLGAPPAEAASRRGLGVALGLLLLAAAGGAGWFFFLRRPLPQGTPTAGALTPEAQAAMARVKELEDRIAQLEREKTEAEASAVAAARQKLEAAAAAKGRVVDPAALARAQEEARQQARAEAEKKQQDELRRIAEQRRAEEKRIAEASPSPPAATPAAAAPTPTPEPTVAAAPPTPEPPAAAPAPTAAPLAVGTLVDTGDPRLVAPVVVSETKPRYPPLARDRGIEGSVELTALVDETGRVAEVRLTGARPAKMGFEEAALQAVRTRQYRPGTKDGVAVRVWLPIVVRFVVKR